MSDLGVLAYLAGMRKLPANVRAHLTFCEASPADCILCLMVRIRIEKQNRGNQ
jgi:hypothetical protein